MDIMLIIWVALLIIFVIIEVATINLVTIWFALGALIAVIVDALGFSLGIQLAAFIIASILGLILTKPIVTKIKRSKTYPTNTDAIIGKTGIVLEEVSKNKRGLVKVEGLEWTAITYEEKVYEKDTIVTVEAVIGVKILIK